MENANKNVITTILVLVGVLILIGAYVLFQGKPALPNPGIASSTGSNVIGVASTTSGGSVIVSIPKGGNGEFGVDTTIPNLKVGDTVPTIKVNLPTGANGKYFVIGLMPAWQKATFPQEVLLATTISTPGLVYNVQGLHLTDLINTSTGEKSMVTPGTYRLEIVIWDKNPFGPKGTYVSMPDNNATAVETNSFTVTAN